MNLHVGRAQKLTPSDHPECASPARCLSIEPGAAMWWATWNDDGNPFYNQDRAKRRAFVAAAVDLIELDYYHQRGSGYGNRLDFMATNMTWWGFVYRELKSNPPAGLSVDVQKAFEIGLRQMFAPMFDAEFQGNTVFGDMAAPLHVGAWYAAQGLGDDLAKSQARYISLYLVNRFASAAGFVDHDGAYDATYNCISLNRLAWAAHATGYPHLRTVLAEMNALKAHTNLPEPDALNPAPHGHPPLTARHLGPWHFSSATFGPAIADQWQTPQRNYALGAISDDAIHVSFTGDWRSLQDGTWNWDGSRSDNLVFRNADGIRVALQQNIEALNNHADPDLCINCPASAVMPHWDEEHWTEGVPYGLPNGTYARFAEADTGANGLNTPPMARGAEFIRQFGDAFVVSRRGGVGAIIHTGDLGDRNDPDCLGGFGGGALSAIWTPATGSVLLGMQRGNQAGCDAWSQWRTWPTHAISGLSANGSPFSSARVRYPARSVQANGNDSATVTVSGVISSVIEGGRSAPGAALAGGIPYVRTFTVDGSGIVVQSSVQPAANTPDRISELYDTIPLYLKDNWCGSHCPADPVFSFETTPGTWSTAGVTWTAGTRCIRIQRHTGTVYIVFNSPQRVRLADSEWAYAPQYDPIRARNLLVDLLAGATTPIAPPQVTVSYRFTSQP